MFSNTMFFAVPKGMVYKAVGKEGGNVRLLSEMLGKKVKIIEMPEGEGDAVKFFQDIISPVQAKNIEVGEKEIIITAGRLNHAALVGRDKKKLEELKKIAEEHFGKDLRIV